MSASSSGIEAFVKEQRLYAGQCLLRIQEAEYALSEARGALSALCRGAPPQCLTDVTHGQSEPGLSAIKAADSSSFSYFLGNNSCPEPQTVKDDVEPQASPEAAKDDSDPQTKLRYVDQIVFHEVTDFSAPRQENSGGRSIAVQAEPEKNEAIAAETDPSLAEHKVVWSGRHIVVVKICQDRLVFPVLNPTSNVRLAWDILGLIFIIYETYAIPFYICFNAKATGVFWLLVSLLNTYFIVDVAASFMTGYVDEQGHKKMAPPDIAHRYIRRGFILDVVAGIPWEWLPDNDYLSGNTNLMQATKMLRLIRISRLLRLLTMSNIMTDRVKMMIESHPGLVFCQGVGYILFLLFSITHWAACLWYQIGTTPNIQQTWVQLHIPEGVGIMECYVRSLYFTLTTMTTVGYGDITPGTYVEICFVSVLLLIATVVFATLMGSLTDLITNLNQEKNSQREKVLMLSRYMHWRGVSREIFMAVRKYLLFLWETNHGYDDYEATLKESLPPALRKELCYTIDGPQLRMAPFLMWMKDFEVCVKELANRVDTRILSRADTLFRVGQPNDFTIFMLRSGSVRVSLNESLFTLQAHDAIQEEGEDIEEEKGSSLKSGLASHARELLRQAKAKEKLTEGADRFSAVVLQVSAQKLFQRDIRERLAAKMIQKRWRSKVHARKRAQAKKIGITTKSVRAPNYFGESCLWTPLEDWDKEDPDTNAYSYTVKCEDRCEVVYIARRTLLDIIQRFSPWLGERFEFFQSSVIHNMQTLAGDEWRVRGSRAETTQTFAEPEKPAQEATQQPRWRDAASEGASASRPHSPEEGGGGYFAGGGSEYRVAAASPLALVDLGSRWSEIAERSKAAADRMLLQAKENSLTTPMGSSYGFRLDSSPVRRRGFEATMPPLRRPQQVHYTPPPVQTAPQESHHHEGQRPDGQQRPHNAEFHHLQRRLSGKFHGMGGGGLQDPLLGSRF